MIYYKTNTNFMQIEEVEVQKETEDFVIINGNRSKKISSYDCYFKTREEAKEYLVNHYQKVIKGLSDRLEYATGRLNQAYGL